MARLLEDIRKTKASLCKPIDRHCKDVAYDPKTGCLWCGTKGHKFCKEFVTRDGEIVLMLFEPGMRFPITKNVFADRNLLMERFRRRGLSDERAMISARKILKESGERIARLVADGYRRVPICEQDFDTAERLSRRLPDVSDFPKKDFVRVGEDFVYVKTFGGLSDDEYKNAVEDYKLLCADVSEKDKAFMEDIRGKYGLEREAKKAMLCIPKRYPGVYSAEEIDLEGKKFSDEKWEAEVRREMEKLKVKER